MVDENVVDREVGLEVIRRGLVTREALVGYAQQRRNDPTRSFTTLLVQDGILSPEVGAEVDRIARARAGGAPPPLMPSQPPQPPSPPITGSRRAVRPSDPVPAPGVGDRTPSGRIAPIPPGIGDRRPSGKVIARKPTDSTPSERYVRPGDAPQLGPGGAEPPRAGVGDRTPSGKTTKAHVNVSMPQHTVMDLDFEVPNAPIESNDPDKETGSKDPKKFQAARTFVDTSMEIPEDGQRTMIEEGMEMPAPGERGIGRTLVEDLEMPAGAEPAPPPPPPNEDTRQPSSRPGSGSSATRRVVSPNSVLTPGKYFGDFEVVSTLGEGAMGQVFRAKRRADGMDVALKVMRGGLVASAKIRERFLREAKAAKMIDHPNVVHFIDAGMIGNDQFLAMEFVEGRSLQSLLNEGKSKALPIPRAFDLFRQICSGLDAAHRAGVIHRDLKPENILITREGEIAKITDFGLARREEESMLLTRPGQIMGSPYYMAPEQGQGLPVDHRADLYSLGAILFCLTTGRVPFPFPSATEVIHAHCELERPDPRTINPEIIEELAAFMLRLLAIDPEQRPQSAAQALQEFEEVAKQAQLRTYYPADVPPPPSGEDAEMEVFTEGKVVDAYAEGTRMGRLTIEGVIGAGGMGAVYRARHDEGRVSALKVLPKEYAKDAKRLKSFIREAELGKKIASPNVVETRDYGNDPKLGVSYIELELVEGTSVESMCKTSVLQQESLLINILRGCAQGLSAMHAAGVIHRDVKPANVLLSGEFLSRQDGGVKIIDLGLAIPKENAKKSDEDFAGTPTYMAPEQTAKGAVVDERSDLYSLGCTIYQLATGHPPFEGKTPQAIAYQHQRTTPMAPKARNATLTDGFSAIIELLLAKDPDDRYATADALVADLAKTDEEGKLKKPEIHAKYRTNRLGKAGFVASTTSQDDLAPPPRRLVIIAAVVAILCGLIIFFNIAKALWNATTKTNVVEPPAPPPPPPPPGGTENQPPPPPSGEDPNKKQNMTEEQRQKQREKDVADVRDLMRNPTPDWLAIRQKYEAIIRDYPDAPLQKVQDKLKNVGETFDTAVHDAVQWAEKAKRSKKPEDWSECETNLMIARQQVSRDEDLLRLKKAEEDIAKAKEFK